MRAVALCDRTPPVTFVPILFFSSEWSEWTGLSLHGRNRPTFRFFPNAEIDVLSIDLSPHYSVGVGGIDKHHSRHVAGEFARKDACQWAAGTRTGQHVRPLDARALEQQSQLMRILFQGPRSGPGSLQASNALS